MKGDKGFNYSGILILVAEPAVQQAALGLLSSAPDLLMGD